MAIPILQAERYRDGVIQALSQGGMVGVVKYKARRMVPRNAARAGGPEWRELPR